MTKLFSSAARSLASRFTDWRRRERAYAELAALDDRALADIGISRAEIPFVVARKHGADGDAFRTGEAANANQRDAA